MSKTNKAPIDETATKDEGPAKLVVASQIRAYIKSKGYCVSGDLIDALSARVQQAINLGIIRADSNGRKTVRSTDI